MHRLAGPLLLLITTVLLLASLPARAQDIVIGEFGSLTGGTATFGISTDEGLHLALDDINAKGGVLGKQIKVIVEDDQSRPEEAVTAVQKLVNQNKVVAVIGEVASSRSLAAPRSAALIPTASMYPVTTRRSA
jgi:branched-chain amino acid transport system substrate-binding protein